MGAPIALAARNIFKQALKSGLALRLVERLITGVARVLELPARGGGQLESRGLGARDTCGALECGRGLTGAMARGEQLSENWVNVIAIGVHTIPDGENGEEGDAGNDAEE